MSVFTYLAFICFSISGSIFLAPWLWQLCGHKIKPTPQDALIDVIVDVVSKDFDSWQKDTYRISHKALGFSMWIANGRSSLGLSTNDQQAGPDNVTRNNIKLTAGQKYRLWKAIQNPMQMRTKEDQQKYAADIIERVIKHYEAVKLPNVAYFPTATTASKPYVVHVGGTA